MMPIVVNLPAPFGPSKAKKSPDWNFRLVPLRTFKDALYLSFKPINFSAKCLRTYFTPKIEIDIGFIGEDLKASKQKVRSFKAGTYQFRACDGSDLPRIQTG